MRNALYERWVALGAEELNPPIFDCSECGDGDALRPGESCAYCDRDNGRCGAVPGTHYHGAGDYCECGERPNVVARMSAHVKRCDNCGREAERGFTKIGNQFSLRGRTRTAQRLNMRSGPAIWECAPGIGCKVKR